MDEKNKLCKDELKNVSGGTAEQIGELSAFIKKHDPGYEINENFDVVTWLATRSGIDFDSYLIGDAKDNTYHLAGGVKITHEQLMDMLNEQFPG